LLKLYVYVDETYVVKSPRAWTWSVSKLGVNEGNPQILSEDLCVNETVNTTPTKSRRRSNKMDEGMIYLNLFYNKTTRTFLFT